MAMTTGGVAEAWGANGAQTDRIRARSATRDVAALQRPGWVGVLPIV